MFRGVLQGLVIVAAASCVRRLPPAPIPDPIAPQLPMSAPPPAPLPAGQSRLVIDVVDGPFAVQRMQLSPRAVDNGYGRRTYRFDEVPVQLCPSTPCATVHPAGTNLLLGFPVIGKDALEVELVNVGSETSTYRRTLSVYENNSPGLRLFGILATSIGGVSAITGTALLPVGLGDDNTAMTTAGAITLGAGVALITLGIWALRHDPPTFRPGSSNHF